VIASESPYRITWADSGRQTKKRGELKKATAHGERKTLIHSVTQIVRQSKGRRVLQIRRSDTVKKGPLEKDGILAAQYQTIESRAQRTRGNSLNPTAEDIPSANWRGKDILQGFAAKRKPIWRRRGYTSH